MAALWRGAERLGCPVVQALQRSARCVHCRRRDVGIRDPVKTEGTVGERRRKTVFPARRRRWRRRSSGRFAFGSALVGRESGKSIIAFSKKNRVRASTPHRAGQMVDAVLCDSAVAGHLDRAAPGFLVVHGAGFHRCRASGYQP